MAFKTRSAVIGVKEEVTEGTLIELAGASEFTSIRSGFSVQGAVDTVDSDELVDSIGASASFTTKETPTASISKYLKHSGVEGQAPDYSILLESAMGGKTTHSTEYNTVSSSTAGTSAAAAIIKVDTGEGALHEYGQALLIKDLANGYSIRNVNSISSDDLTLNFNLGSAPASGVNLGKAVHYTPENDGHPTYSLHHYQSSGASSGVHQAVAGCRTTSVDLSLPVNDLASADFSIEGIKFYYNPIVVSSANNKINFKDEVAGSELTATLESKAYQSPKNLAAEVAAKMTAASAAANADTISCTYDSLTGKYTIATDGLELELLWATGTNAANAADTILGFAADVTGATTYTGIASTYAPAYTPSYDESTAFVVKNQELLIGSFSRTDCRGGNSFSVSISTPKTDVESFCAESGVSESVVLERAVTASTTLIFKAHELDEFDAMINNSDTQLMFNAGVKDSAGNWVAGKCVNIWMPKAKITSNVIADNNGYLVVEIEAKGFVTSSADDIHINYL